MVLELLTVVDHEYQVGVLILVWVEYGLGGVTYVVAPQAAPQS